MTGVQTCALPISNSLKINTDDKSIIAAANNLIANKYDGDCSSGCILPIALSGILQNLTISNIKIAYTNNLEWNSEDKIYSLTPSPATLNFSGLLDLGLLGFKVSKTMNYTISLNGVNLINKKIKILPSPTISFITPPSPPAGVPINFYAKINFTGNNSLTYKWNFGDKIGRAHV